MSHRLVSCRKHSVTLCTGLNQPMRRPGYYFSQSPNNSLNSLDGHPSVMSNFSRRGAKRVWALEREEAGWCTILALLAFLQPLRPHVSRSSPTTRLWWFTLATRETYWSRLLTMNPDYVRSMRRWNNHSIIISTASLPATQAKISKSSSDHWQLNIAFLSLYVLILLRGWYTMWLVTSDVSMVTVPSEAVWLVTSDVSMVTALKDVIWLATPDFVMYFL